MSDVIVQYPVRYTLPYDTEIGGVTVKVDNVLGESLKYFIEHSLSNVLSNRDLIQTLFNISLSVFESYSSIKIESDTVFLSTGGAYNYLPMMLNSSYTEIQRYTLYPNYLRQRLVREFNRNYATFAKCTDLILNTINSERKLKILTHRTGDNKDTKNYDNNIHGESDTKSMNENSPINATIGDIVTPNNKNNAEFNSDTSKTGTDTIDYSIDENVDDTHTETSPEYFMQVMKILDKYNIPKLIDKIFRSVIAEFNTSL